MNWRDFFYRNMWLINFYPPFIGAGVRLSDVNKDRTRLVTTMNLRWYNRNVYKTHFGGSLYTMCDPFFVFILAHRMGNDYILWDQSASIKV